MPALAERRSGRGREVFTFASSRDDMEMVLDSVIGPPREESSYGGPTIPLDPMSFKKSFFFFLGERFLGDVWIKLIVPSQSTTFPYESISLISYIFIKPIDLIQEKVYRYTYMTRDQDMMNILPDLPWRC